MNAEREASRARPGAPTGAAPGRAEGRAAGVPAAPGPLGVSEGCCDPPGPRLFTAQRWPSTAQPCNPALLLTGPTPSARHALGTDPAPGPALSAQLRLSHTHLAEAPPHPSPKPRPQKSFRLSQSSTLLLWKEELKTRKKDWKTPASTLRLRLGWGGAGN